MTEEFLHCDDDAAFWKAVGEYMPDNSFICINSDLSVAGGSEESADRIDGFTKNMKALVKLEEKLIKSECSREKVIPEAAAGLLSTGPILILPVHFWDKIVGYMGVWNKVKKGAGLDRVMHFLFRFHCSAGLKLTEYCGNGVPGLDAH